MKTAIFAVLSTALFVSATGCSDPCGDAVDCCNALAGATGCDLLEDQDSDACEAYLDLAAATPDAPEECSN